MMIFVTLARCRCLERDYVIGPGIAEAFLQELGKIIAGVRARPPL